MRLKDVAVKRKMVLCGRGCGRSILVEIIQVGIMMLLEMTGQWTPQANAAMVPSGTRRIDGNCA
jgi:hypothetical protein